MRRLNQRHPDRWGLARALWDGVRDLFPTRKTKMAMWGVVGLGVVITYLELTAAQLFSTLITSLETHSFARNAAFLGGFLLTFAAIKGIGYFQSVYRLTIFEKSLRRVISTSQAAESWRWPMAINLVGLIGQLARLLIVTVTVAIASWMYGALLALCTVVAVLIVNRTGQRQYAIHHEFVDAKRRGQPPSAAERISTRIRAGERAGLVAVGPVLVYVAALGAGAASGRVTVHSALVLFIAGRMAGNMYGTLSNTTMRLIRAQVNVEAYGGSPLPERGGGSIPVAGSDQEILALLSRPEYISDPPHQAFARLIDDGHYVGDVEKLGRIVRQSGYGPSQALRSQAASTRPEKLLAVAPNQAWWHDAFVMPIDGVDSPIRLQVVIDIYSRMLVRWRLDQTMSEEQVKDFFAEVCRHEGLVGEDVAFHSTWQVLGSAPTLHDLLASLGVVRTLVWTNANIEDDQPRADRPSFPTRFASSEEAEAWTSAFAPWYNDVFYQPAIGYLHPSDVHAGLGDVIMAKRLGTLETLLDGKSNPFPGGIPTAWLPPEEAWLDPTVITTVPQTPQASERQALQDEDEDEEM